MLSAVHAGGEQGWKSGHLEPLLFWAVPAFHPSLPAPIENGAPVNIAVESEPALINWRIDGKTQPAGLTRIGAAALHQPKRSVAVVIHAGEQDMTSVRRPERLLVTITRVRGQLPW